ncbi:MAG: hypothetical protein IPJ68_05795 [Candidatus Moraniibacteriota bacterium]|nr:MAG: hypothetical protein IPJ68_05795 [Candidatus Moranbacteria bacterium]
MEKSDFLIAVSKVGRNSNCYGKGGYIVTVAHRNLPSVFLAIVGSVAWIEYPYDRRNVWSGKATPPILVVHDGKGEGRGGEHEVRDSGKKGGEWRVKKTTRLTEDDPDKFPYGEFAEFSEEKTWEIFEPDFYPSGADAFADSSVVVGYDAIKKRKEEILAQTINFAIAKAQEVISTFSKMQMS